MLRFFIYWVYNLAKQNFWLRLHVIVYLQTYTFTYFTGPRALYASSTARLMPLLASGAIRRQHLGKYETLV